MSSKTLFTTTHAATDKKLRQTAEKAAIRERLRKDADKQKASEERHREIGLKTKQWTEMILPKYESSCSYSHNFLLVD